MSETMDDVLNILNDNKTVFLATVDGDKPAVRPVQFCFEKNGKLWFSTAKDKPMYKQMQTNPAVEIAVVTPSFEFIRIRANVELIDDLSVKERILGLYSSIKDIYLEASNPTFTTFCISHGEIVFWDFSGHDSHKVTF